MSAALWLRDSKFPSPGGVAVLSPWLDTQNSLPYFMLNGPYDYLPKPSVGRKGIYDWYASEHRTNPLASPIMARPIPHHPLTPVSIYMGDAERLMDASLLESILFKKEVQVNLFEDAPHVSPAFASLHEFSNYQLQMMGQWIQQTVSLDKNSFNQKVQETGVFWIRKNKECIPVPKPLDVIWQGRNELIKSGKWTEKKESIFLGLLKHHLTSLDSEDQKRVKELLLNEVKQR